MGKNLLILGAGGHGRVVREVALSMSGADGAPVYSSVDFLDDNAPDAVGRMADLERVAADYDEMISGIGNCEFRKEQVEGLLASGCCVPVLVHPTAYVSPSAEIAAGTVIEPNAIVNTGARVGVGCIVTVGAVVDHDSVIGDFSHVNTGAICMAGSKVEPLTKVGAGEVVSGFNGR